MSNQPSDAPPSYDHATLPGAQITPEPRGGAVRPSDDGHTTDGTEDDDDGAIPSDERMSMLEDSRGLPEGWVRMFDSSNSNHAFYVDTQSDPPRSIWTHPYDDLDYLKSLPESSEVRQHYVQQYRDAQALEAKAAANGDKKDESAPTSHPPPARSSGMASAGTSASAAAGGGKDERSMGRKIKDKMTGKSHDERVRERRAQQELELKQYQQFVIRRKELIEQQQANPRYAPPMTGYPGSSRGYRTGGYGYGNGGMYGGRYGGGLGYGGLGLGGGLLLGGGLGMGMGGMGGMGMGGGGGMGC